MYAIITNRTNVTTETYLGQVDEERVVLEVEQLPAYDYEDITESDIKFKQRVYSGDYDEEMCYKHFVYLRELIVSYGEQPSMTDLLIAQNKDQQEQIEELQEAVAEIVGGGA